MTNISNNDKQAFYLFLKEHGGIEAADSNNDGVVKKSEFSQFLQDSGFDFASLDGWNGEWTESKATKDIITQFFNEMNTDASNKKIKVDGKNSRVKQKDGLDTNEQANVTRRIEVMDALDNYVSTNIDIPSYITNTNSCINEIKTKLIELAETNYIKTSKSIDDIDEYFDKYAPKILLQVVTEQYASEAMANELAQYAKDYDYKFEDDATLKGMINKLLKKIDGETDVNDIKEIIDDIISKYIDTLTNPIEEKINNARTMAADVDELDEISVDDVWYNPTVGSKLNPLQEAVLKTELKTNMKKVVSEYSNYESYKTLYDAAVDDFVAATLQKASAKNFEELREYGKTQFEESDAGIKVLKTVEVKDIVVGDELGSRISNEFTTALRDYISENRRYLKAMTKIEDEIIEKVLDGEYGDPMDKEQIMKDIIKEIKSHIADFYENGFGDMDLETLNKTYDVMLEAALAEPDPDKSLQAQRDAAIKYCDTIAKRNTKFRETVNLVFGDNYANAINKMMPTEIGAKILALKSKVLQLGDAKTFKVDEATWGNLATEKVLDLETVRASAQQYLTDNNVADKLEKALADKKSLATANNHFANVFAQSAYDVAKIYIAIINSSNNVNDIINAVKKLRNNDLLKNSLPEWTAPKSEKEIASISIIVGNTKTFNIAPQFKDANGNDISPTSDRITYKTSNDIIKVADDGTVTINAGSRKGDFDTTIQILVDGVVVGEKTIRVSVKENIDLSKSDATFEGATLASHLQTGTTALPLSGFKDWDSAKTTAKESIVNYMNTLVARLEEAGYESGRLKSAAQSTINYYNAVIDAIYDNCYGSGDNKNTNIDITYIDSNGQSHSEATWYNQNTHEYERDAGRTDEGARTIGHDSCGIRMNESYSGTNTYEYYINTAVLLTKFQSFLNNI